MNRTPVTSTSIKSVGYDSGNKTLEVEFKAGKVWQYQGVGESTFKQFISSGSLGAFFHQNIKGKFNGIAV